MSALYFWISALISPLTIVGNVLVCVIVFTNASMRTFTNYLLVNLAIADLCYGLLQALGMIVHAADKHFDWTLFCKSANYTVHVTCGVSIGTLTVIAVERYFAVVKPLQKNAKKRRRASILLFVLWVVILSIMVPVLLFPWGYKKGDLSCEVLQDYTLPRKIFYFIIAIVFLFAPSCVIVYCYSKIIYTLWYSPQAVADSVRVKSRRKLAQMLLFVSGTFVTSWLTVCTVQLFILFDSPVPKPLEIISHLLVHLNTGINPIVYSLHSADFRRHLKKVWCCDSKNPRNTINTSYGLTKKNHLEDKGLPMVSGLYEAPALCETQAEELKLYVG